MALPYSSYSKKVKPILVNFSYEQLLFIGTWVSDYLDRTYGPYFKEIGHQEERVWLQVGIAFLWKKEHDEFERKQILKKIRSIDIDNLDFAVPAECGILKIMEAVERMLCFITTKKTGDVLATAWYPLDVLNAIKDSEVEPYMTPPAYKISDPVFKEEMDAQLKLFEYMSRHSVDYKDRLLFRQVPF